VGEKPPGFEAGGHAQHARTSPALRQYELKEGSHLGPFFIIEKGRWGFEPSKKEGILSDAFFQ
jgi:hypothetical protein